MKLIKELGTKKEYAGSKAKKRRFALMLCDCGNTYETTFIHDDEPKRNNCGCQAKRKEVNYINAKLIDTVPNQLIYGKKRTVGIFKCNCGASFEKILDQCKEWTSCGCTRKEMKRSDAQIRRSADLKKKRDEKEKIKKAIAKKRSATKLMIHKNSMNINNHKLKYIWENMKRRCYSPTHPKFKIYGGRGVTICSEWINDYPAFYDWCMNNNYKEGLQLDKDILSYELNIDPPIYSPITCKFVTIQENLQHRSIINKIYHNHKKIQ